MRGYAEKVANLLGWQRVGYQPETRWMTSGTKAWKTEKVFSGPLDRMWSGYQKVSAWEGTSAIRTTRSTGVVMTGTENPTPNMMTPFRTQRALKDSSQSEWNVAPGWVPTDMYYDAVYAAQQRTSQGIMSRFLAAMQKVSNG